MRSCNITKVTVWLVWCSGTQSFSSRTASSLGPWSCRVFLYSVHKQGPPHTDRHCPILLRRPFSFRPFPCVPALDFPGFPHCSRPRCLSESWSARRWKSCQARVSSPRLPPSAQPPIPWLAFSPHHGRQIQLRLRSAIGTPQRPPASPQSHDTIPDEQTRADDDGFNSQLS